MYGTDLTKLSELLKKKEKSFKRIKKRYSEYNIYLEVYKDRLRKYFKYVYDISIIGLKSKENPIYCLIFCTSNDSAKKLFLSIESDLNKKKKSFLSIRNLSYNKKGFSMEEFNRFIESNKRIDDYLD